MTLHPDEPNDDPQVVPSDDPQTNPIPPGEDPSKETNPRPDLA